MQYSNSETSLKRIAVFYDGSYFMRISQFFKYHHKRAQYISIDGFHDFIRNTVAHHETSGNVSLCQIVDSHFFRGRFSLLAAQKANTLDADRYQDQILMQAGVTTHFYPMNESTNPPVEKGIDVWLALEAYDLAVHKRFDVLALVTGDQDHVPLIRKVSSLGTRVLLIGYEASYTDQNGRPVSTKTSSKLIDEATYTIMLNEVVDSKANKNDQYVEGLFRI